MSGTPTSSSGNASDDTNVKKKEGDFYKATKIKKKLIRIRVWPDRVAHDASLAKMICDAREKKSSYLIHFTLRRESIQSTLYKT